MTLIHDTKLDQQHKESLLSIRDLQVMVKARKGAVYPLQGVSLDIMPGETLGIVGESGSGKSMTALTLMGLLPDGAEVSGGTITFDGKSLIDRTEAQARAARGQELGMIFQDPLTSLNPTLTIGKQVTEALRYHTKISQADANAKGIEILRKVGMPRPEKVMTDYPHQLSGGMRQRVMIAIALINQPKLLIADEPTTALDVTTQKQILDLIDSLKAELNTAVMFITHDMGVVAGRCDRIAVMYAGRIVEIGSTLEIFRNPQHQYTRSLIAALPEEAQRHGNRLYSIPGRPPQLTQIAQGCAFADRCAVATEVCRTQTPPLLSQNDANPSAHNVACHHPGGEPISEVGATLEAREVAGEELVKVDNVRRKYAAYSNGVIRRKIGEVHAVSGIDMVIRKGETLGVVGESGCGKSTFGRMLAALEQPDSGVIDQGGLNRKSKQIHRAVQMMFQDSAAAMDPRMTIAEILDEPMAIQKTGGRKERLARATELIEAVGLDPEALKKYPHQFSGGQLQRIGLARALALRPDLIVCDEPVSALDVSVQAQVLNLMMDLQRELGLTYVFISHDLAVVRYISDRVAVMYMGQVVELGPAHDVVDRPLHPYTKALIESIPVADPEHVSDESMALQGEPASALNPPAGCRFASRCPLAQEVCFSVQPELKIMPQGTVDDFDFSHSVACHFPLESEAARA